MRRDVFRLTVSALLLLFFAVPTNARLLQNWPYGKLMETADLVVIAQAISSASTDDRAQEGWGTDFHGVNTQFKVHAILKGNSEKKLTVLHFEVPEKRILVNGPLHIQFRTVSKELKLDQDGSQAMINKPIPEYLLFLKKCEDGRYEPVSGRIDPVLSIRVVTQPMFGESEE